MAARVGSLLTLSMFCRSPCGRQLDTSNTLWSFHSGFRDLGYCQDMFNHTCTSWGWHIQVANLGTKHLQDLQREHLEMLQECFPEQAEIARATRTARTPNLDRTEYILTSPIPCPRIKAGILFLLPDSFLPCDDFKLSEFIQAPPKQCPALCQGSQHWWALSASGLDSLETLGSKPERFANASYT